MHFSPTPSFPEACPYMSYTPLFGPKMIIQFYKDFGGSGVWVAAEFDQHAQWWVGYHSPNGLE